MKADSKEIFKKIFEEIDKVVVGQKGVVEEIMITVLCNGNGLLEGYPGLAKTLAVRTLARIMDLKFSRIQSTPDLMPSDITGTYIIEEHTGKRVFKFQPGPIFANLVLVDEINRATPKTQSALLEAMQEKQVTVGNKTFALDPPFFVLATQNPVEQEGTYPLPEAQADRFLLKIQVDYPNDDEEEQIVERFSSKTKTQEVNVVLNKDNIKLLQGLTLQMPIANDLRKKAIQIITSTRKNEFIEYGASPRASIGLIMAAKARALLKGRTYVSAEDISEMARPILRHRIILTFDAHRKGKTDDVVIDEIVKKVL